jgi:hypothetical protein
MRMSLGPYISAAALALCSFFVLMWVRSYDMREFVSCMDRGNVTVLSSNKGAISLLCRRFDRSAAFSGNGPHRKQLINA